MDLQPENDSDLNVAKDCRRQQRKGKGMRSSALQTEQQMSSGEMEFQNASQDLQGNDESHRAADAPPPPEKLMAGVLGVVCLILVFTVARGILLLPSRSTLKKNYSSPITKIQKAHSCGHCPHKWLTYSNNCYYVSTEEKTWTESSTACASKNSSLVCIDDEEERKFLSFLSPASWIGVFRRSSDQSWMLINGSTPTLQ
ncbi:NKG2-A/NKG2-B type II integral membrane protein-like [Desmodus rotundus]|uniref:NKG2-A/NKG2-B type II integral membrane protein-like n=1 Tax=Desmodus rotundus TaxID=9430 RepID=UPI0023815CB8|nr:NKG2-A/NKG2-B type II integral membrane protein-like [Desmodus rotundus]